MCSSRANNADDCWAFIVANGLLVIAGDLVVNGWIVRGGWLGGDGCVVEPCQVFGVEGVEVVCPFGFCSFNGMIDGGNPGECACELIDFLACECTGSAARLTKIDREYTPIIVLRKNS